MSDGLHSPNLAPLHFHLFGPSNKRLPGNHDASDELAARHAMVEERQKAVHTDEGYNEKKLRLQE